MKINPVILLRFIIVLQLCAAVVLGLYSLGISMAATRSEDNFTRYKQELQNATQQAKTLEAQLSLSPAQFAGEGYDSAVSCEHFSTTICVASIVLFFAGLIQLWAIRKPIKCDSQKMPAV
jgi:hypothetical protein